MLINCHASKNNYSDRFAMLVFVSKHGNFTACILIIKGRLL